MVTAAGSGPGDAAGDRPGTPWGLLRLLWSYWHTQALRSAVELDVCTVLATGPRSYAQLLADTGMHPWAARDFLDLLVALGVLEREGETYANGREAGHYLDAATDDWLGGYVALESMWSQLPDLLTPTLRTGRPRTAARDGGELFDSHYAEADGLRHLPRLMAALSASSAALLAERFPWQRHRSLLDLGCAEGHLAATVLRAHPQLHGTGFDLPPLRTGFERRVRAAGVADRLRFQPGDFLRDPLPSADVVVLGHVLHDWGLSDKRLLLAKAYAALPPGGALLVVETLMDHGQRADPLGLVMSLSMRVETPDGFDFTAEDCRGWLRDAGFSRTSAEPLDGVDALVTGIK